MSETLKFIHASDLHLDVAISGLLELPQHLIEVLANAPYHAAVSYTHLTLPTTPYG